MSTGAGMAGQKPDMKTEKKAEKGKTGKAEKREKTGQRQPLGEFIRSCEFRCLLVSAAAIAVIAVLFLISVSPMRYSLKVGEVSTVTVTVPDDEWEDIAATQEEILRAENSVQTPYYSVEGVSDQICADIDSVLNDLRSVMQYAVSLEGSMGAGDFTQEELDTARQLLETREENDTHPVIRLSDMQLKTLMRADPDDVETLCKQLKRKIRVTQITEGSESSVISNLLVDTYNSSSSLDYNLVYGVGKPMLDACGQPNYLVDHALLEQRRAEARAEVEPVIYKRGQLLIQSGEVVTAELYELLYEHGMIRTGKIEPSIYIGSIMLVAGILVIAFVLLKNTGRTRPELLRCVLCAVSLVLTFVFCVLAKILNLYLAPVLLGALLLTSMLGLRAGVIMNIALSLITAALAVNTRSDYALQCLLMILCGISSGTVAALMMDGHPTRLRALVCLPAELVINFGISLALGMMIGKEISVIWITALWLSGGAVLATLLFIGAQPLLEMIFNLPTPLKLMELSNPTHPLLRKLLLEAPGTYHHSLIVANLAEASAEAVGADPLLARVGGYYHDVGKLKHPLLFKENQQGEENAHDHTDPQVSAAILTAHTGDGVAIGRSYRLPRAVLDIIACHHGNTPVMYFYHKAMQQAEGKSVNIDLFRYQAEPPSTKEGAIILLCDTIEAAVRSMKSPTPGEIEAFIVKLIRGKLEDGQLSHCPLTLQDIDRIGQACITVLTGVFHERIEYPTMNGPIPRAGSAEKNETAEKAEKQEKPEKEEKQEKPEAVEAAKDSGAAEPSPSAADADIDSHEVRIPDMGGITLQIVTPEKEGSLPTVSVPEAAAAVVAVEDLLDPRSFSETEIPKHADP